VALKNAAKTITKIRRLLQVYAIAKPSTRLSLRVLGNISENYNLTYSPKPTTGLIEAALIVIGAEIITHCTYKEWPTGEHEENNAEQPTLSANMDSGYKLTALLPKTDAGNDAGSRSKQRHPYLMICRFLKRQYQRRSVFLCRQKTSLFLKGNVERDCKALQIVYPLRCEG
jgi:hypothetical protein